MGRKKKRSRKLKLKKLQTMSFLVDHLVKTPFFLPQRLSKTNTCPFPFFPPKKLLKIYVSIYTSVRGFYWRKESLIEN